MRFNRQHALGRFLAQRFSLAAYTQILTGSVVRLVLQAGYFGILVNALSLADYGVFASVLALSLILAGGGAFGFTAPLFRAATTRRRILGAYLTAFLVYVTGECAVLISCALAVYAVSFHAYLPLGSFLAILLSETVLWRITEMLNTVNIGLGRYRHGAMAGIIGSAGRLAAVLLFMGTGAGGLVRWTEFYITGNLLATSLGVLLLWPRSRLRWNGAILRRRLREAVAFWAINTLQTFQIEADKLIVLGLAGEHQAGVYALSMRVIELMLMPIKSFFPPYVKSLLRSRERFGNWRRSLAVEGGLAVVALLLFGGATLFLAIFPDVLGANIARAARWFENLPLVPVSRAMLDYHRELMFAAERLATYACVAFVLAGTRLAVIAAVLMTSASIDALVMPLNGLAVSLYAISASVVWGMVIRPPLSAWWKTRSPQLEDVG